MKCTVRITAPTVYELDILALFNLPILPDGYPHRSFSSKLPCETIKEAKAFLHNTANLYYENDAAMVKSHMSNDGLRLDGVQLWIIH